MLRHVETVHTYYEMSECVMPSSEMLKQLILCWDKFRYVKIFQTVSR